MITNIKKLFLNKKTYIFNADLIRVLSAAGVVLIHTLDPIYDRPDFFGGHTWWLTHFLSGFLRICVPLFIMLSGYLNLGKNRNFQENWQKIITRVLIPLSSFLTIYIIYDLVAQRLPFTGLAATLSIFWNRFNLNTNSPLYFLIILFFLYLLHPFFDYIIGQNKKIVQRFLLFSFLIALIINLAKYTTFAQEMFFYNTWNTWISYIGYYFFGYYIKNIFWSKKKGLAATVIYLSSLFITVWGSFLIISNKDFWQQFILVDKGAYFMEYLSLPVILQSLSSFYLLMKAPFIKKLGDLKIFSKIIKNISSNSFGIYLFHVLAMYILNFSVDNFFTKNLLAFLLCNFAAVFGLSYFITLAIRQTPLKAIVGEKIS